MTDQTPPQSDFQISLGDVLKNRRVALGRSIEQLSAMTRIHSKTLRALEENQYSELPARAFTRGFIVSYAKALGLSGEELIKIYHQFLEEKFSERPNKEKGHEGYAFESKEKEQNKRWLIALGSVAAVFAVVVLLFFKPQNHKRKEKHKEFTEEAVTNSSPTEETVGAEGLPVVEPTTPGPSPSASIALPAIATSSSTPNSSKIPVAAPTQPPAVLPTLAPSVAPVIATTTNTPASPEASPSPTPVLDSLNKGDDLKTNEVKKRISFEATEDTWVRYQSDEKKPMILMLRKGKFLVIKAKEKIHFDTKTPNHLKVRPKTSSEFKGLEIGSLQVADDGSLTALEGGVKGLPETP